jgi:hypothetical protein
MTKNMMVYTGRGYIKGDRTKLSRNMKGENVGRKHRWEKFVSQPICNTSIARIRQRYIMSLDLLSELSYTTAASGTTLIPLMTVRRLLESQSDLYHEFRSPSIISFGSG